MDGYDTHALNHGCRSEGAERIVIPIKSVIQSGLRLRGSTSGIFDIVCRVADKEKPAQGGLKDYTHHRSIGWGRWGEDIQDSVKIMCLECENFVMKANRRACDASRRLFSPSPVFGDWFGS